MGTEGLVLKELKHGGPQGLRHAVDLIEKENSLLFAALLHIFINRGNYFAHGIFGNIILLSLIGLVFYNRKPQGALTGMVGHGICHQRHI